MSYFNDLDPVTVCNTMLMEFMAKGLVTLVVYENGDMSYVYGEL